MPQLVQWELAQQGEVSTSCAAKQWSIGVQGLYLHPANSSSIIIPGALIQPYQIKQDGDWGYRLDAAYYYNSDSDLSVNWSHYDAVDNNVASFPDVYPQITPLGVFALPGEITLSTKNKYDQVNLVTGQQINFGLMKHARFYGGIQYAAIRFNGNGNYALPSLLQALTQGIQTRVASDFEGVGPVIGMDFTYNLTSGFSIIANTAGSLLVSSSRYNSAISYNSGLVVASIYNSKRAVVPSMEAKLGVNWALPMAEGTLNIQGFKAVIKSLIILMHYKP